VPWDLAISQHGDLVFSGGRDWQFVDGEQLMNQRIINRLRIKRGSWIFNRDSTLGSDLDSVLGRASSQQLDNIPHLVSDALDPIKDEINVQSVNVTTDELGTVFVILSYSLIVPDLPDEIVDQAAVQLIIPISGVTA
jgi:hypothetical protein